ncbi:hypothetical protein ADL27_00375 [Streptomyces sp. NRRL F-6602]|nr:hypothetical protein ADL27_00375 [Streptomyces sp. NRRL F-6602]
MEGLPDESGVVGGVGVVDEEDESGAPGVACPEGVVDCCGAVSLPEDAPVAPVDAPEDAPEGSPGWPEPDGRAVVGPGGVGSAPDAGITPPVAMLASAAERRTALLII